MDGQVDSAVGTPKDLPPAALDLASKLFDYAREGKTPELRQYLEAGIPLNIRNGKGDTFLMLAAYHGKVDTVRMLLEKGADPDLLNDRGQSPLSGAIFKDYPEVVEALYRGNATISAGHPNAVDCARMFKKDNYLSLFGLSSSDSLQGLQ